jgi:hypothetical protein
LSGIGLKGKGAGSPLPGPPIYEFAMYTHAILGLPHRAEDLNRTAITTVILLLLWMFSAYKIYLVVSRLSYLETFLHVCAWCRRIEYNDRWLSLEAHFTQKTGGRVSHGICPECSAQVLGQVREGSAPIGG